MLLNVDEIISELDLCDEMTDVLKSEIKIVEGQFDLIEEETEMIKEKFPHLDIKKVNIFRTNKNPEIQYDFEDITISQEEDKSVKSWENLKIGLISFTETIYGLPELIRVLKVKLTSSDPVCSTTVSSPLLF